MESLIKVEDKVKAVAKIESKGNYTLNGKFKFVMDHIRIRGSVICFRGHFPTQNKVYTYYIHPNFDCNFDGYGNSDPSFVCHRKGSTESTLEAENVFQAIDQFIACQYDYQLANHFSNLNMHYRYVQDEADTNLTKTPSLKKLEQEDEKLGKSADLAEEIAEVIKEQKLDAKEPNAYRSYNRYDK